MNKIGISRIKSISSHLLQILNSCYEFTSKRTIFTITDLTNDNRRKEYVKKEIVGFTMEQMYGVVADVSNYYKFVPYVQKSVVHSRNKNQFKADLIIGFPPLKEIYTSIVTEKKPILISSECKDGKLFTYLLNEWKFSPGVKDIQQSCVIDFKVTFEFKSILHRKVANLFFDLICDQMENAFKQEAKKRYGPPPIKSYVLYSYKS